MNLQNYIEVCSDETVQLGVSSNECLQLRMSITLNKIENRIKLRYSLKYKCLKCLQLDIPRDSKSENVFISKKT